jgi:hypothetical protein
MIVLHAETAGISSSLIQALVLYVFYYILTSSRTMVEDTITFLVPSVHV